MLQYLVVLLDNAATSFCHYSERKISGCSLISLDDLRRGILFAMKENLEIQFVYPNSVLPQEYKNVIDSIDHSDIVSSECKDRLLLNKADVIVYNHWDEICDTQCREDSVYILRTSKEDLFRNYKKLSPIINNVKRLNVVLTDLESFVEEDFNSYSSVLAHLSHVLKRGYAIGKSPQLNIITDRLLLENMNNCNAGVENITLAPDGKFYVCPAFYYAGECDGSETSQSEVCQRGYSIGSLNEGLDIKNSQLYKINHAPICQNCDAYQCKRCVWLNRKMTFEVNTPSHEQCVLAHLERNTSRKLLYEIRTLGSFLPDKEIKEISYLDPFDVRTEW